jgi:D-alanyl-D-alanine carboxypeptidase (penicillin-binding protein 5/6)
MTRVSRRLSAAVRHRIGLTVLSVVVWALTGAGIAAQEFSTRAKQAILMDADTGAVFFQHNADELMPPASMSKLMTLAMLFKALKTEQRKPTDELLMSEHAWRRGGAPSGGSAMFVPVGTRVRVDELMQGIIVQSGNDAAIAVAEELSGSEALFAKAMTEEARRLGLKQSTFRNATGLYEPDHLMTARELALLARHIVREYPEYYQIFSQRDFTYRKHRFTNRNPLLTLAIGVDGLKTGFIKEAGYGMVASAKQGDRRLIAVVNGLTTAEDRKEETRKLLEWGFRSFTEFKLFDAGEVVGSARVWGGDRFYVPLTGNSDVNILLPRNATNHKLKAEIVYKGPLKAPIRKGEQVARLRVTSASNATNEVPLYAAQDVVPGGMMRRGLDSLAHLAFSWVP